MKPILPPMAVASAAALLLAAAPELAAQGEAEAPAKPTKLTPIEERVALLESVKGILGGGPPPADFSGVKNPFNPDWTPVPVDPVGTVGPEPPAPPPAPDPLKPEMVLEAAHVKLGPRGALVTGTRKVLMVKASPKPLREGFSFSIKDGEGRVYAVTVAVIGAASYTLEHAGVSKEFRYEEEKGAGSGFGIQRDDGSGGAPGS